MESADAGADGVVAGLALPGGGAEILRDVVVAGVVGPGELLAGLGEIGTILGAGVGHGGVGLLVGVDGLEGRHLVESTLHLVLSLGPGHLEHTHKLHLQRCEPLRLSEVGGEVLLHFFREEG